jgi:YesN/AraC family two-component response regulator
MMGIIAKFLSARSYKQKIYVYFLLLSITPVCILGTISSQIAAASIQHEVDARHETVLNQMQYRINMFFNSMEKSSMLIASNRTINKTYDVGPSMKHLDLSLSMIKQLSEYRMASDIEFDVSLVFHKFDTVYSNRYGLIPYSEFPYRHLLENKEFRYDSLHLVPPNDFMDQQELLLVKGMPIYSSSFKGYLVMHVKLRQWIEFLQQLNPDNDKKILVVDADNRIILSDDPKEMGTVLSSPVEVHANPSAPKVHRGKLRYNGQDYMMAAAHSSFNDWTYVALTPYDLLTGKSNEIRRLTWSIVVLLLFVWLILIGFASNRIYVPIQRILAKLPIESKEKAQSADLQVLDAFMYQMVKANMDMQRRLQDHAPILKESFRRKLLWGEATKQELQSYEEMAAGGMKGPWFAVAVIEFDQYHSLTRTYSQQDLALLYYALRKLLEETAEPYPVCLSVTSMYRQVVAVVESAELDDGTAGALEELFALFRKNTAHYLKFTVTVGVSRFRKGLSSVSSSYQEAVGCVNYRLFVGNNSTIMPKHIQPALKQSGQTLLKLQKSIAAAVVRNDLADAKRSLTEMIEAIPNVVRDTESAFGIFVYILGDISSMIEDMGYDPRQVIDDDWHRRLYEMSTLQEIEAWFVESVFPAIADQMRQQQLSEQKKRAGRIKQYIDEHFEDGITLKQAAAHFEMSQSQLSRLFKEEMGVAFSDYLMKLRMDKAKEWLQYTDMPIKVIAERLSYTSVQNFTRSFRQIHAMPPAAYREYSRKQQKAE